MFTSQGELLQDISQPRHNSHYLFTICLSHYTAGEKHLTGRWVCIGGPSGLKCPWQYWSVWYNSVLGLNICLGLEVNMLKNDTLLNSKHMLSLSGKTCNPSKGCTQNSTHQYNCATPSEGGCAPCRPSLIFN